MKMIDDFFSIQKVGNTVSIRREVNKFSLRIDCSTKLADLLFVSQVMGSMSCS